MVKFSVYLIHNELLEMTISGSMVLRVLVYQHFSDGDLLVMMRSGLVDEALGA